MRHWLSTASGTRTARKLTVGALIESECFDPLGTFFHRLVVLTLVSTRFNRRIRRFFVESILPPRQFVIRQQPLDMHGRTETLARSPVSGLAHFGGFVFTARQLNQFRAQFIGVARAKNQAVDSVSNQLRVAAAVAGDHGPPAR